MGRGKRRGSPSSSIELARQDNSGHPATALSTSHDRFSRTNIFADKRTLLPLTLQPVTVADRLCIQLSLSGEGGIDGYTLACPSESSLPPGLKLNPDTWELSGEPAQTGTFSLELVVSCPGETSIRQEYELEVARAFPLQGKLIVVSGAIPGYLRTLALQALRQAGAEASNDAADVRNASALLVSGQTSVKLAQGRGTTKTKAAQTYGVPMIQIDTQADFADILSGRRPI
jgi:NAD-dependent DNA ligase